MIWMAALLVCMLVSALSLTAQEGEPFMNHFKLRDVADNRISCITEDGRNSMFFTSSKGVLSFDSEVWQTYEVPNIPLSVAADSNLPMLYVGGRDFLGYLLKTEFGSYEYHSLSEPDEQLGDITNIYQTGSGIIFYGDEFIGIAERNALYDLERFRPDSGRQFAGMLIYRKKAYVNIPGSGLFELGNRELLPVGSLIDFAGSRILFGIEYGDRSALLGLGNRIYLFNGEEFREVTLEDQEYLDESYLKDAAWLERDEFALSTVLGGCMIVDVSSGRTINILNSQTGLPDDEIYAIGMDRNHGLWMSHQYGLTRVDVRLPVREYEHYPGLRGNLTSVAVQDSILYIGTTEGIFFLEEKKDYLEQEILIKVRSTLHAGVKTEPQSEIETENRSREPDLQEKIQPDTQEQEIHPEEMSARERRIARREARKETREADGSEVDAGAGTPDSTAELKSGGLRALFQRITGKEKSTESDSIPVAETVTPVEEKPEPRPVSRTHFVKQKIYSLQSVSHEFTRIGEFNEKAKDLVPVGDRILVSTNEGLYELVDKKLSPVRYGWYIEGIFPSADPGRVYVLTDRTAFQLRLEDGKWVNGMDFSFIEKEIHSVCEENSRTIWLGCDNMGYRITHEADSVTALKSFRFHSEYYDPVSIMSIQDTVFFFLTNGIYFIDQDSIHLTGKMRKDILTSIQLEGSGVSWIRTGGRWISMSNDRDYPKKIDTYLRLFNDITDIFLDPEGNAWVVSENSHIYKIVRARLNYYKPYFELYLKKVYNDEKSYPLDALIFDYYDRSLVFDLSAPFYLKDNSTSYQYYAEGISENWSEWTGAGELNFPVLQMGKFTLHLRAKNVLGQVSYIKSFPVQINPPWWLSLPFLIAAGISIVLLVLLIIRWRVRKLKRDKEILEMKVNERTLEIQKQRDEISDQKREIMDSIYYAQRIQKAVLPADQAVEKNLPEHFIVYKPRDIVSGDFYWISSNENRVIFTAADCTGHGVPGAFMSMLGVSFLNEIASAHKRISAGKILDTLRSMVKDTLSQSEKSTTRDGMDIALCIYDREKGTLQYAGAHNPLYLVRNNELTEFRADTMPIGIHLVAETDFTTHTVRVEPGDCLYIFSDGFQDQFGGPEGKKFLSRSMKEMFLEVHRHPMSRQDELIEKRLKSWMEGYEQVDDILVFGVRI